MAIEDNLSYLFSQNSLELVHELRKFRNYAPSSTLSNFTLTIFSSFLQHQVSSECKVMWPFKPLKVISEPEHGEVYCKPPIDNISSHLDDWIKIAHPLREKNLDLKFAINYCEVYKDADQQIENFFQNISKNAKITNFRPKDSTKLIPCSSFEHQPVIFTSIITQFRLYCSRDILVAVTQFSHLLGVLCGGLLTSYMLKFIEPRRTMLIGMVMVSSTYYLQFLI